MQYLSRWVLQLIVTVVGVVTVTFFLMRAIPGDPALYMLGDYATADAVASLRAKLGLDLPVAEQYLRFMGRALSGDLGASVVTGQSALKEVMDSVPWSIALTGWGMAIAVALGVPLGVVSASRQGTWVDTTVMVVALGGISFPVFWIGLVAILGLSHWAGLFPTLGASSGGGFWTAMHHLALPALVLGVSVAAYIARLTRSAMLEVLGQDYIRVARALGVPKRRVLYRLALRNAAVPILAVISVTFAWSLGNAILVEMVFSRPGLGSTIMKAVLARDYQLVQAGLLVLAAAVVLVNATCDLLYVAIDPRLKSR
ncbi:ABC transporter permease [Pseudorhodoferax sp. Leaf274]|uniref:ABC transporter permease n=1 Tax=Pseudorhodoferax sp. Leaf274 TaxID=1736318 RepID=UPI000703416C|nr:ABC transporter permease [Pseudorhodoferax sp. Leaf274]KQP35770.1 peptide ABC transporter permease [Pseudorhodoferax sp. Leaf274]